MRVIVVGAGVMGLPTARVLADRGHDVVLIDRHEVGNSAGSSSGPSRIWRLAHGDDFMVRHALDAVDAWADLEERSGQQLRLERGLLWRSDNAPTVLEALTTCGVAAELVDPSEQATLFPELARSERPVLFQPQAGVVLASEALAAERLLFERAGGELRPRTVVKAVEPHASGVRIITDGGAALEGDVAVLAPGPWAQGLLASLGVTVSLEPVVAQVSYFGTPPDWEHRPCVIEAYGELGDNYYAMPTPGIGFKIGLEEPLRNWTPDDFDRTPSPEQQRQVTELARRLFPRHELSSVREDVCCWTSSADDLFVLDRIGNVVVACGDSGAGFKFLPQFGRWLADLAEGNAMPDGLSKFSLSRFS